MKLIFLFLFLAATLPVNAQQQNTLLNQAFWQAAPDVNAVKAEVAKGNSPSEMTASAMDPVVLAINAQAPTASILFLLSQPGNPPSKITHDSRTYLHWAANRGNIEVLSYLLKNGARVDVPDNRASTPLLFAAGSGQQNTAIYDLLLAHGSDLKKERNADGANALLLAIANDKDFTLTQYFISKGLSTSSVDAAGNNAFCYAARSGNIDLLKTLVAKGFPTSNNAFFMAAQGGARRGAATPGKGPAELFAYLESLGLKPTALNGNGENLLHTLARRAGQADLLRQFIGKGLDVNQTDREGNNVLMNAAASNRDTAVVNLLLAGTKNINQANKQGMTALSLAVRSNSADLVALLLSKGAQANVLDSKGNNLAFYLLESYRPVSATARPTTGTNPNADFEQKWTLLTKAGLNIATPQKNGSTLYHLAVAKNDLALFTRIAASGIDINAKDEEGLTALHKAALVAKDDRLLQYLLSAGANKSAKTNFNETAFDLASENETLRKNNVSLTFLK